MVDQWQRSVFAVTPTPPQQQLVVYTAVIGLELERSTLSFNASVDHAQIVTAVETPPEWTLTPWPPTRTNTDADVTIFALAKLKAIFDFAAQLPDGSTQEIKNAIDTRFPLVRSERAVPTAHYKRFAVEASIMDDGKTQWGYDIPGGDDFPPGVVARMQESELDIFIQNLVRADLQQRLESFH